MLVVAVPLHSRRPGRHMFIEDRLLHDDAIAEGGDGGV